ncbi:calponin 3 [Phyllostomus discolor]|uniref:Calponin n=1 Tax=Phyllostomus discolor TaxID=89673 RepID=A0A833YH79_9CHIR|nr:calponin 3 [Phyllostomus discolor]
MTHFNKGPSYGLSAEVKNKIASKYDHQAEEDLRGWIEEVTGMSIGPSFQLGLKDGIILCELINKLQPGSVRKVNESSLNWPQLENIGNFIKAIQAYGMKPHDIFEANDLFENGNMTQVQTTLVALAGLAKTKGFHTTIDLGVKYAEKQTRRFDEGKLKAGQSVIGLQMGTNKCASQAGMTAYGTRRHLYDPKMQTDKPFDQTTISLQMGTNKGASQAGMPAPGTRRDIYELGRQVYDPKYCAAPTEPVIHNGSQGTGTNGSEISDSDYQAEYPDEYPGEYPDDYPREYPYGDQGVDY